MSVLDVVDLHVTRVGARALYPSTGRDSGPKVLSDYMIERLPEPVRSMVLERIEGRRKQVEVVLEAWRLGCVSVLIRNKAPEPV